MGTNNTSANVLIYHVFSKCLPKFCSCIMGEFSAGASGGKPTKFCEHCKCPDSIWEGTTCEVTFGFGNMFGKTTDEPAAALDWFA